jgi:diguanylate cyclase (GGDEF)-like protein/PAS domain S-box-containing protein
MYERLDILAAKRKSTPRLSRFDEPVDVQAAAARLSSPETVLTAMPNLVCAMTPGGQLVSVNPAWERLLGWREEDLVGRDISDLVHRDDRPALQECLAHLSDQSPPQFLDCRTRGVHGGHRFLRWSLWAHPAEKLIYATASDIEDLHREAFEGRLLGQASHIGIWELEPETNMIHWSSEAHALHGNPPGSPPISLDDALRSYPADSRERLRAALADLRENGIGFDIDAPFHVPLGTSRQVRIQGRADLANGRVSRIFGTIQDITAAVADEARRGRNERRLRALTDGTNVGSWEWNVITGEQVINERWAGIIGYAAGELEPVTIQTFERLVHPDDLREVSNRLHRHFLGEQEFFEAEIRMKHKDGHWVWVQTRGSVAVWTEGGEPHLVAGTHQDITAQKTRQIELQTMYARLNAIVENAGCGIALLDSDLRYVVCNQRTREMFDMPDWLFDGPPPKIEDFFRFAARRGDLGPGDEDELVANRMAALLARRPYAYYRTTPNGRTIHINSVPIAGAGVATIYTDVTAERESLARIDYAAHHDVLTGLANRAELKRCIAETLEMQAEDGAARSIFVLDLDRFKAVNDTLGHAIGDGLLKAVADRILAIVRDGDVTARLGGDEFAVLLRTDGNQREETSAVAARLLATISAPYEIEGRLLHIGVSIGVALAPDHGRDADTLIRNADFALYKVKAHGKNGYRLFDADLEIEANARRELEADLRQALELEQFELHYQPVVALNGGRIVGAEALLRWRHPTRGFVPPDTLIPIAEETGLIVPIGEWVIRQACREAALWPDDIRLAVNISTAQLGRCNLVEVVTQALAQSGLPASRVEIEVTETIFLRNDEALLADLRQLHALGVRLALDDFGTGYSSLGYLRKLPFGKIKIDRSFISDLGHDIQSAAVVCAVANLACSLFIETTAEGVETEDQARLVATAGCTHGQGYLFGRPMPNASLIDMLSNRQGRKVA